MIWLLAGLAVALLGGLTLRWTAVRLRPGVPLAGMALVAGGAILRWVLAAGLLVAALGYGVESGLAAFAGVWVGRWIVVYWLARNQQKRYTEYAEENTEDRALIKGVRRAAPPRDAHPQ